MFRIVSDCTKYANVKTVLPVSAYQNAECDATTQYM